MPAWDICRQAGQASVFGAWKEDAMHRRAMLKLLGILPAAAALPATAAGRSVRAAGKLTPDTVRDMEHLADRYRPCTTPPRR